MGNKCFSVPWLLRVLGRQASKLFNRVFLHYTERVISPDPSHPFVHPPIFIIGAPRSGSTLLMQILTEAFDVGYISNLHCLFYGAPSLIEKWFHPTKDRPQSDYHSKHGVTKGWASPAECGAWWYRFFRRKPAYVTLGDVDGVKMRCFRRSLAALISAFGRPLLFKNMYVALRLDPLLAHVPEALIIVIKRDVVDNAHSLLEVRKRVFGCYEQWWSMEPPGCEGLKKLPPARQVVEQIVRINELIEEDRRAFANQPECFFSIQYEDLCHDVHGELARLESFFRSHNVHLQRRHEVPRTFVCKNDVGIPADLSREVKEYAESRV
ncbi:MAG: sulfotransferase [Proteobacteria bacterium]|nr:sulfotransferase [Pseudomonadota bacterium]